MQAYASRTESLTTHTKLTKVPTFAFQQHHCVAQGFLDFQPIYRVAFKALIAEGHTQFSTAASTLQ